MTERPTTGTQRPPLGRPLLRAVPAGLGRVRLANYAYRAVLRDRVGSGPRATQLRDGSRFDLNLADWPQAEPFSSATTTSTPYGSSPPTSPRTVCSSTSDRISA